MRLAAGGHSVMVKSGWGFEFIVFGVFFLYWPGHDDDVRFYFIFFNFGPDCSKLHSKNGLGGKFLSLVV